MDRERRDELPKMQMEFINLICIPLYSVSVVKTVHDRKCASLILQTTVQCYHQPLHCCREAMGVAAGAVP